MSMMLMVKAMQIKVGNPLRKLVLLKLADNASDSGECWPSHQHIADQCEISKRSVIKHIQELVKMGLVRVEHRTKNNEKQSNLYHLTLDRGGSEYFSLPSAANSLPSAGNALPGAGNALPGAANSPGGSESPAHRTSHFIEPINESVNEPSSNREGRKKKNSKFDPISELVKRGANEQHVKDFLANRSRKFTQSVLDHLEREVAKSGISIALAIQVCAERGWQSYQAHYNLGEYMPNNVQKPLSQNNATTGNAQVDLENANKQIMENYAKKRGWL